jgi:DNA-binding NarL/FixJ family response regulator
MTPPPAPGDSARPTPPPVTVLIADPHPLVRLGLRGLLADFPGLAVVGDGPCEAERVVEMARALTPDVVVVGGPDAVAVTARLREAGGGPSVLVLSGREDVAAVRRALWSGAGGYALMRSPGEELVRAVRAVAAGSMYLDPAVAHTLAAVPAPDELSEREAQSLRMVARGYSNKEIAGRMGLSVKSVETYKARGLEKLGLEGRVDLVRLAVRQGWLTDEEQQPAGEAAVGGRNELAG